MSPLRRRTKRLTQTYAQSVHISTRLASGGLTRGIPRSDWILAGVLLAVALASALARKPFEGPLALTVPVAVVTASSLLWRTRSPLFAITLALAAELTQTAFGHTPGSLWSFAIVLILMYSVAAELSEVLAAAGGIAIVVVESFEERIDNGVDYLFIAIVFGGAWLIGRGTRDWHGRATHAESHQHELAQLAVAEERVRIARELHDVVAHGLSVIAVQADAAEAALAHDAGLAAAPLRAIRSSAREALAEMRQLLNLLRSDDSDDTGLSPARGFADLTALTEAMTEAGLPIDADLEFGAAEVGAGLELATYRIVQEGLTNVLKHAGAVKTQLAVTVGTDAVNIRINNGPGPAQTISASGGRGLVGMRERVHAAGGSLHCGPVPDGGYVIEAQLPREQV